MPKTFPLLLLFGELIGISIHSCTILVCPVCTQHTTMHFNRPSKSHLYSSVTHLYCNMATPDSYLIIQEFITPVCNRSNTLDRRVQDTSSALTDNTVTKQDVKVAKLPHCTTHHRIFLLTMLDTGGKEAYPVASLGKGTHHLECVLM